MTKSNSIDIQIKYYFHTSFDVMEKSQRVDVFSYILYSSRKCMYVQIYKYELTLAPWRVAFATTEVKGYL